MNFDMLKCGSRSQIRGEKIVENGGSVIILRLHTSAHKKKKTSGATLRKIGKVELQWLRSTRSYCTAFSKTNWKKMLIRGTKSTCGNENQSMLESRLSVDTASKNISYPRIISTRPYSLLWWYKQLQTVKRTRCSTGF